MDALDVCCVAVCRTVGLAVPVGINSIPTYGNCASFPPYVSTPAFGTPCRRTDFGGFVVVVVVVVVFYFYFTAIVKGVIALEMVCVKR